MPSASEAFAILDTGFKNSVRCPLGMRGEYLVRFDPHEGLQLPSASGVSNAPPVNFDGNAGVEEGVGNIAPCGRTPRFAGPVAFNEMVAVVG